ncbi:MAG: histidine ammonia-lyase [Bacteroidetes bacterium]|jgi:histidine ammonia-lyase|nr:histidine ammonia-lyase [Bacteroidota bacterium]
MEIGGHILIQEVQDIISSKTKISLSPEAIARTKKCFNYVQDKIKRSEKTIYGINTGFGSLCNTIIPNDELELLQINLLKSHACGTGDVIDEEIVRLMLLLKVLSLTKGHSGVQVQTVEKLIGLLNNNHIPVVYEQGSLGASGDLAPLAHMALPLIGLGDVWQNGAPTSANFLEDQTYNLMAKEGLALINGTQFMAAFGVHCVSNGLKLVSIANQITALSADAFDARIDPYLACSHEIRGQKGQQDCAAEIYDLLKDSPLQKQDKEQVQDPYSFRCAPQVHGASLDALRFAETIFTNEINAVTDNPNVFPDEDLILSAGNFHGQTLAIQLDHMAIALAEIANISERRIYKLISGERGLPAFLIENPGVNSGFMIAQYTAAGIVSQNKQLCTPASVDSIVSSNGQEDHVSMGANAATKCYKVLQNTITVLGIEVMIAAQGLNFRRPGKSSESIERLHSAFREQVPYIKEDVYLREMLVNCRGFIETQLSK